MNDTGKGLSICADCTELGIGLVAVKGVVLTRTIISNEDCSLEMVSLV